MADPILDEDRIIALLSAPIDGDHADQIRGGAVQTLLDLYDRKCTRDEYIRLMAPVVALYGQTAQLRMLTDLAEGLTDGTVTIAELQPALADLHSIIHSQTGMVIQIVKTLKQCPTSRDAVN